MFTVYRCDFKTEVLCELEFIDQDWKLVARFAYILLSSTPA